MQKSVMWSDAHEDALQQFIDAMTSRGRGMELAVVSASKPNVGRSIESALRIAIGASAETWARFDVPWMPCTARERNISWSDERGVLLGAFDLLISDRKGASMTAGCPIGAALVLARIALEDADRPAPTPEPSAPLRALRERAQLSQSEAASKLGMKRGPYANAEKVAQPSAKMLARARVAFGLETT